MGNWRKMADQSAETELLATMMLEGCETVPDGDTSTTTETVQREGDTECQAEGSQAEGSLGDDNLASSSSEDSQEEHTIGQRRAAGARARKKSKKDKSQQLLRIERWGVLQPSQTPIWLHFRKFRTCPRKYRNRAVCMICLENRNYQTLSLGVSSSTGTLRNHLRGQHRSAFEEMLDAENKSNHKGKRSGALLTFTETAQKPITAMFQRIEPVSTLWNDLAVELVVKNNLPFTFVEDPVFRSLCEKL